MSVVAEFTIPTEALPGGETLVAMPEMEVELERVVPTQESALPFFWVWGSDPAAFMESLEDERNIDAVDVLERVSDGALFRAEWAPEAALIRGIERLDATVIEAVGTAERWRFEVRTQEREAFAAFQEVFESRGISVRLDRLYDLAELVEDDGRTLTPAQRETLLAAYRKGYFETPRGATQEDLAEAFEVSPRAVSERLRRGVRNLVATTLLPGGRPEGLPRDQDSTR